GGGALTEGPGRPRSGNGAVDGRGGDRALPDNRHFPDEESVFRACTGHWYAENPPPDPAGWAAVSDPEARLRLALGEIYAWYRRNEAMIDKGARDAEVLPALAGVVTEHQAPYWRAARRTLAAGWEVSDERREIVAAGIGHATEFSTWRSLVRTEGLSDAQASDLMTALVACAARV
ncbi:MAG TPA: hypothetical protein PKA95_04090, partial [Thermomicrobiales bacterium]|nr:hypothetical protein [Thermomicrobiales bacterium]